MGIFKNIFNTYNSSARLYKTDTLKDIEAIPVPKSKFKYTCDFTESIEYVLQRKATQFKKQGNIELAIACLKKSNQIMPFAPMIYSPKDYRRLEEYLKQAGKFDEARAEQEKNSSQCEDEKIFANQYETFLSAEYLEVPRGYRVCSECAKYHDRIYYNKIKDKKFPCSEVLRKYYFFKQCDCTLQIYHFFYNISTVCLTDTKNFISYSNRPFIDDRTNEEKIQFDLHINKILSAQKDRDDYDWIRENLSHIAPKSFGGYKNMKNKNSANYKKLVDFAKEKGYTI